MACCQAAQWSSAFCPCGSQSCGAVAKIASPVQAAASGSRRRWAAPSAARVSRAGTHHTQWWDQETGEISRAAKAFSDRARQSPEAASARRIPRQATVATTADTTSQVATPASVCGPSPARARTARMD